jgi:hypothetical protein
VVQNDHCITVRIIAEELKSVDGLQLILMENLGMKQVCL